MTRKVIGSDHIGGRRYLRLECGHAKKAPEFVEVTLGGWFVECHWCDLYGPLRPLSRDRLVLWEVP